jgi:hypothetical protein
MLHAQHLNNGNSYLLADPGVRVVLEVGLRRFAFWYYGVAPAECCVFAGRGLCGQRVPT